MIKFKDLVSLRIPLVSISESNRFTSLTEDSIKRLIENSGRNCLYVLPESAMVWANKVFPNVKFSTVKPNKFELFETLGYSELLDEYAATGDFRKFKRNSPKSFTNQDITKYINEIRTDLDLQPIVESDSILPTEEREEFFNGKFSIGSIVKSEDILYEVMSVGTNYLTVIGSAGVIVKKWPAQLECVQDNLNVNYFFTDNKINENFNKSLIEFGTAYTDKFALVSAYNSLMEYYENKSIDNLVKSFRLLEKIKQLENHEYLRELLEMEANNLIDKDQEDAKKQHIASVVSKAFGINKSGTPEEVVNHVVKHVATSEYSPQSKQTLKNLIVLAQANGIAINQLYHDKLDVPTVQNPVLDPEPNLSDIEIVDSTVIDHSHASDDALNSMSDEELDSLIDASLSYDDYLEVYDDEELQLVDSDTGEVIAEEAEYSGLNEVLSRTERIRSRIRFARSETKRERKIKIALRTKSSNTVLTARAHRLAIKLLKTRFAHKPVDKLSVSEKERLEARLAKSKPLLKRLTLKLINRVRQVERTRLDK